MVQEPPPVQIWGRLRAVFGFKVSGSEFWALRLEFGVCKKDSNFQSGYDDFF